MGFGIRNTLTGLLAATTIACSSEQPIRYAAFGPGILANNLTVSKVLCDTASTNPAIRKSPLLKEAFTATPLPSSMETATQHKNAINRSVLERVLNASVTPEDNARIMAQYSWRAGSRLDTLRMLFGLPVPEYSITTDTKLLLEYGLEQFSNSTDSIPAAFLVLNGMPHALARVRFKNKIQHNTIVINPFFVNEALTVSDHEKVHILQFTPESPLNVSKHPYEEFIVEGVATYLNERLRHPLPHNPAIEQRLRDHFARLATKRVHSSDDPNLIIKYRLLPAFIAHDAITYGPVQAVLRAGKIPSCAKE